MTAVDRPASSSWLELAACRGKPTSWWYPERGDRFAAAVARSICRGCRVRGECLAAAVAEEAVVGWPLYGVRGGLTAEQRRRLVKRAG